MRVFVRPYVELDSAIDGVFEQVTVGSQPMRDIVILRKAHVEMELEPERHARMTIRASETLSTSLRQVTVGLRRTVVDNFRF